MSFSSAPQPPPSGLNAEAARAEQRQRDDRSTDTPRPRHLRPVAPDSLHRMVARVRTALRARGTSR